jgi:hypothetical protein
VYLNLRISNCTAYASGSQNRPFKETRKICAGPNSLLQHNILGHLSAGFRIHKTNIRASKTHYNTVCCLLLHASPEVRHPHGFCVPLFKHIRI